MISTNALSVFILHHHQNGICNKNIHSIQEIMHTSEPDFQTYKKVCNDLPNITILPRVSCQAKSNWRLHMCLLGTHPLGDPLRRLPWQDHSTCLLLFQSTSPSPLTQTATRSAFPSLNCSFAPPPATSHVRKISRTRRRATPSSSRHS